MSGMMTDPVLLLYSVTVAAVLGAVLGSFINCAAIRIVRGESFLRGRSHCADCGHPLRAADLIPVGSYLVLRGKCRYCGKRISPRYMLTELLLAAVFVCVVLRFGLSGETLRYMGLAVLLLGLSLVDLETYRIPDGFILAGILWFILTIPVIRLFPAGRGGEEAAVSLGRVLTETGVFLPSAALGAVLIAGFMLLLSLVFDHLTGRSSLGGGDIKLFFLTGLYLGPASGFLGLMLSTVFGLLLGAAMRRERIPYGPAIACAAILALLLGEPVVTWYLSLF